MTLNIDLGERADEDETLYALAHVANVACGGHAGDDASMARAVSRCRAHGTELAAHPSFPDRDGFGRRDLALDPAVLADTVAEQCARLRIHADAAAVAITVVKAHGALYHAADRDPAAAAALLEGARRSLGDQVRLVGPGGGVFAAAAARAGFELLREGFADRGLLRGPDGRTRLVPRGQPGALITDPGAAAAQTRRLVLAGDIDTVCVHGDGEHAVAIARAVREALGPC